MTGIHFRCAYPYCRQAFKEFTAYCAHIQQAHETPALAEYVPVMIQGAKEAPSAH